MPNNPILLFERNKINHMLGQIKLFGKSLYSASFVQINHTLYIHWQIVKLNTNTECIMCDVLYTDGEWQKTEKVMEPHWLNITDLDEGFEYEFVVVAISGSGKESRSNAVKRQVGPGECTCTCTLASYL